MHYLIYINLKIFQFRFLDFLTGKSCQQAKLKTLRLRRALVGSVDAAAAAANETTFEISVASVAGQKPSIGLRS